MDFLGLKNLSIMKDAVENIKRIKGIDVDVDTIPIDDKKTYDLYCDGYTLGTFQFESAGMQKYLRELKPTVFEDLIAMNALYRPGPMDYIPDFIDRKHGRKPIEYDIPIMETYLKDTYGITVYQEQVMLLSRLLGNFTRGEADTLRKAMGKKLRDKLDEMKPKFLKGGIENGHDEKKRSKKNDAKGRWNFRQKIHGRKNPVHHCILHICHTFVYVDIPCALDDYVFVQRRVGIYGRRSIPFARNVAIWELRRSV
jgi:DNA polymerase-3 subunit alpha